MGGLSQAMEAKSKGRQIIRIDWYPGSKTAKVDLGKHKDKGVTCNDCHPQHTKPDGTKVRYMEKCGRCHKTKRDAFKVGHKLCKGCHQKRSGPTTCKGCH